MSTYCAFMKTIEIREKEKVGRHGQYVKIGRDLRKHHVCNLKICILQ